MAVGALLTLPTRPWAFNAALEGLTRVDERILVGGGFPPLYQAGVRYRKEPREVWRHVADVMAEGWGDCEDLAAWRAAELRVTGVDPGAAVQVYKSGPRRYHAIVRRGDGSIEDPSRKLGMKAPNMSNGIPIYRVEGLCDAVLGEDDGGQEDAEEPTAWTQEDPTPEDGAAVTTDVRENGDGEFQAVARVPMQNGRALVTRSSPDATPDGATGKALNLAARAMDSPAAQALLPPGAKLALNIMRSPEARKIAAGAFKVGKKFGGLFRRRRRR